MMNENRLIEDFWKQTKTTIWKHMDAMAVNYAVYSNHLRGFAPFLTDKDIYIYANTKNVVVVCVDSCGHSDEQIYEESEQLDMLIYSAGFELRESMVWKLVETKNMIKKRLSNSGNEMEVYGVLLTEASITNADELEDVWDEYKIKVIEGFSSLKHRWAAVNNDEDNDAKKYFDVLIDDKWDVKCKSLFGDNNDDDEFEELLKGFMGAKLAPDDDNNLEYDSEKDEEESDEVEETPDDVEEKPDDNEDDTPTVTDGEIEQNDTHSVKVQILNPIKNARKELDRLVGCRDIKRRMDELLSLTRYNNMKREMCPDSKQHEVSLHSVFFGRPGTGKTTVCKIFGSLLHDVGALSKGHVVVCDRSTFIGTLWGDEERAMRQVVDLARGGVLMLDEAYLLNGQNTNDPGKMVIQLLMNLLADEKQRDLAVVICGYKEPMMKLLEMNPGLHSRFPNRFEFADFSFEELLDITQQRIREYDYHFTRSAWEKYKLMLQEAYAQRDPMTWGNARFIANQLDRIYLQHARRCVSHSKKMDRQHLQTLTPADIMPMEVQKRRPHVGF